MAVQPPREPALPVKVRLIVRYAKRNKMRFASHRDIARTVERGIRKAGLPIAYSAGFTPHPRISYAGAAPTGTASEAEYLELSLTDVCEPSEVRDRLAAALPDGIDVIDVMQDVGSLAALRLEASLWQVALPGIAPQEADRAVASFLGLASLDVERLTSKGTRRVDVRAAVITMGTDRRAADAAGTGNAILRMVVRHVVPAVRPDDILAALRQVASLAPSSPPVVTRLAQGPLSVDAAGALAAADGPLMPVMPQHPAMTAAQPSRGGAAQQQVETTRPGTRPPGMAGALPVSAHNLLPRGAEVPMRSFAPGGLTGDYPDARNRAERNRVRP